MGVSPEYFLDEMGFDEIAALLKANEEKRKEGWEMVRQQCFYTVASYNDKIKKPSDLIKFPWDAKEEKKVSKLSKEQLKKKSKTVEKWLGITKQA